MKKTTINHNFNLTLTLKESDIAFIGVVVTIVLYVMNVFGTGVIVGGDVGRIGSGIPYYGFIAPIIFIVFAAVMAYFTKRKSMNNAFKAIYITLALPFAVYPLAFIFNGTPILIIPMFLCMPVGSLFYYLHDKICDLLSTPIENIALSMDVSAYKIENVILILIIAVLLIPIIVAPLVYRFTKSEEV